MTNAEDSERARAGDKVLEGTLTVAEAATFLGIGKQWIYILLNEGRITEINTRDGYVRLVDAKSVQAYADQRAKSSAQ